MSISGVTFGAIKLKTLITGILSQMSSRNLIAGYTVVPSFARETDHIGTGKNRFTSFMRLFVLHVGEVGYQGGVTKVFLNRVPAGWQSKVSQRAGILRIKVSFHMTMAHGHPQQPFRWATGQGAIRGGLECSR